MERADNAVQRQLYFVIEMTGGTHLAVLLRITFDSEHYMSQSWDAMQPTQVSQKP